MSGDAVTRYVRHQAKHKKPQLCCGRLQLRLDKPGMLYLYVWIAYAARELVLFVLNKLKVCLCVM